MENEIIEAIKSEKAHLVSSDRLRRMFYDVDLTGRGEWQVWGQERKHGRTKMLASGEFDLCLAVLVGKNDEH